MFVSFFNAKFTTIFVNEWQIIQNYFISAFDRRTNEGKFCIMRYQVDSYPHVWPGTKQEVSTSDNSRSFRPN